MKKIIVFIAFFNIGFAVVSPSPTATLMAGITVANACFFHAFTLMIRNRSNKE